MVSGASKKDINFVKRIPPLGSNWEFFESKKEDFKIIGWSLSVKRNMHKYKILYFLLL